MRSLSVRSQLHKEDNPISVVSMYMLSGFSGSSVAYSIQAASRSRSDIAVGTPSGWLGMSFDRAYTKYETSTCHKICHVMLISE